MKRTYIRPYTVMVPLLADTPLLAGSLKSTYSNNVEVDGVKDFSETEITLDNSGNNDGYEFSKRNNFSLWDDEE